LVVGAEDDPLRLVPAVRERIRQIDPDVPLSAVQTMDARVSASMAQPRLQTIVLAAFASLALFLAAVGTYGVMSYAARQRTREIGIRMALGATSSAILVLLLRKSLVMVDTGLCVGRVGARATKWVLRRILIGVRGPIWAV